MSGDPTAASIWSDADVYISSNLSAVLPANASAPFGVDWTLVGLLNGDTGFEEDRAETITDHYAWGGLLVATTRAKFKLTKKFTVLEDNVMTRSLIWPGSTATQLIVPKPGKIKIGFETRMGGKVKRLISRNYAQVDADTKFSETEVALAETVLIATIFPDAGGVLYDRQAIPSITSLAITPLTLALSLAGSSIKTLVATATYSDLSTGIITAQCGWASDTPAKATVDDGYVTAVTTGTANVTASYGGVTSTAPCVVTVGA